MAIQKGPSPASGVRQGQQSAPRSATDRLLQSLDQQARRQTDTQQKMLALEERAAAASGAGPNGVNPRVIFGGGPPPFTPQAASPPPQVTKPPRLDLPPDYEPSLRPHGPSFLPDGPEPALAPVAAPSPPRITKPPRVELPPDYEPNLAPSFLPDGPEPDLAPSRPKVVAPPQAPTKPPVIMDALPADDGPTGIRAAGPTQPPRPPSDTRIASSPSDGGGPGRKDFEAVKPLEVFNRALLDACEGLGLFTRAVREAAEASGPKAAESKESARPAGFLGRMAGKAWKGLKGIASKGFSAVSKRFPGVKAAADFVGKAGPAVKVAGKVAAGVGKVAAGAAGAAVAGASIAMEAIAVFKDLAGQATAFVGALNPSAVRAFDQAMNDTSAAVGLALEPALQSATAVVRMYGAALLPAMEKMRPAFEVVGGAMMELGQTYANVAGGLLTSLAPAVKFTADVLAAMVPVVQAGMAIYSGLFEVTKKAAEGLLAMLGFDAKTFTDGTRTAMEQFRNTIILATASLVKMISTTGGSAFIEGVKKALDPKAKGPDGKDLVEKKATDGLGAVSSASIGDGVSGYYRNVMQAALMAGPSDLPGKKDDATIGDLLKKLDTINQEKETFIDKLSKAIGKAIREAPVEAVKEAANGIGDIGEGLYVGGLGFYDDVFGTSHATDRLRR